MANNKTKLRLRALADKPPKWVKKHKKAKFGKTYKISKAPTPKITSAERKRILHEATGKEKYGPSKPKKKRRGFMATVRALREKQKKELE